MRPYDCFVVHIPKRINDTMTLSNGKEIFVDNRFNEFDLRVNEAEIMYVPFKGDTKEAQPGDTLYFHHHVVINEGQPLSGKKDTYLVRYTDNNQLTINSQAFCYRPKGTKSIIPLSGWCILEPIKVDRPKQSEIIEVVSFEEENLNKAKVAFHTNLLDDYGLKVNDIVGFRPNTDYAFKIDGKEYFRTRLEDLLYVEV
jgi:hypothetical protein